MAREYELDLLGYVDKERAGIENEDCDKVDGDGDVHTQSE